MCSDIYEAGYAEEQFSRTGFEPVTFAFCRISIFFALKYFKPVCVVIDRILFLKNEFWNKNYFGQIIFGSNQVFLDDCIPFETGFVKTKWLLPRQVIL